MHTEFKSGSFTLEITGAKRAIGLGTLDPIRVFVEGPAIGSGHITIACWDMAWTVYFGSTGKRSITAFFAGCDAEYLTDKLISGMWLKKGRNHEKYLNDIVIAVQDAFKAQIALEPK